MTIEPVAFFRSPISGKFGIPRQPGVVEELRGCVEFTKEYARPEALRGLGEFDYVWLIWGFSLNRESEGHLTVRPPRLGGNERTGVFASRSPYRPNRLGLSSVRIASVDLERCVINVLGADLADGTPIFDVKPYLEYADSHTGIRSGFVDGSEWQELEVRIPDATASELAPEDLASLRGILAQDPRPRYQDDPERVYGITFAGRDVKFKVEDGILTVL